MLYTLVFLEEGYHSLPRCPKCDRCVSCRALKGSHWSMVMCAKWAERKRKRLREEEVQAITAVAFWAYERPLETVT